MRKNVSLDPIRVVALVLIGAGIYLSVGATAMLIYAGVVLLAVSAVVELRRRGAK
jgi:hypothetical protein